jgi:hypothetical protein
MATLFGIDDATVRDLIRQAGPRASQEIEESLQRIVDEHLGNADRCHDYKLTAPIDEDELLTSELLDAIHDRVSDHLDLSDGDEDEDPSSRDGPFADMDARLLRELSDYLEDAVNNFDE